MVDVDFGMGRRSSCSFSGRGLNKGGTGTSDPGDESRLRAAEGEGQGCGEESGAIAGMFFSIFSTVPICRLAIQRSRLMKWMGR